MMAETDHYNADDCTGRGNGGVITMHSDAADGDEGGGDDDAGNNIAGTHRSVVA